MPSRVGLLGILLLTVQAFAGECDDWGGTGCTAVRSGAWWQAQILAGNMGPSGNANDAMCNTCGNGNIDCSGCVAHFMADHAEDPLQCFECEHRERGCCQWTAGYDDAWVSMADAFSEALTCLYNDKDARQRLAGAIAAIPDRALTEGGASKQTLSTAQRLLFCTVYEHVSLFAAGSHKSAIRRHVPAGTCPNVLRLLDEAEAAGIIHVMLVTSKCAAGDVVACKPGSVHHTFLSMLMAVATKLGICVLVWDIASRLGPCRRQKAKPGHARGGCAELTAAELWLDDIGRGVMLEAFKSVAKGNVQSVICWGRKGWEKLGYALRLPHYRFLFQTIGSRGHEFLLYRLARTQHLVSWLCALIGNRIAYAPSVYEYALGRLPHTVRMRYARPTECMAATAEQWDKAMDPAGNYSWPMSLDTSSKAQRAHGALLGYSNANLTRLHAIALCPEPLGASTLGTQLK